MLAELTSVDDVKELRDRAEALHAYAKQAGLGLEAQNRVAEVKIGAERRAGELLAQTVQRGGDRRANSHGRSLLDLGLTWSTSSRRQRIARLDDDVFDYLRDRESRGLSAKSRRTQVHVGRLLAPVQERERPDLRLSLACDSPVTRADRHRFRLLANREDRVEELLEEGHVTRRAQP